MNRLAWTLALPLVLQAANYSAKRTAADGIEVVQLSDPAHATEVSIVPSIGNIAFAMTVHGKNILWNPFDSLAGILLNSELGNIRRDENQKPIHGLLMFSPHWKVTHLAGDDRSARVTSRLEFWRYPELMAQFPFAHAIEMTYKLAGGMLEIETLLENQSSDPMPVAVGYHPYFQVPDIPRDQCNVHVAAREHLELSPQLVPTGAGTPVKLPDPAPLATTQLDDVFSNLVRGKDDRAEFWVEGGGRKISVIYGPKYTVAIVYAPPGKNFICFEPMSAITNAFNLAHAGIYKELQSIPPGGTWRESFWIAPSGF
jgi:aldose 1-epimerase